MAPSLVLRPYAEVDRAAVLALFDANVPSYFAADERGWLEDSLDDLDGPPFVVTIDGAAAAFGGYEIWGLLRQGAAVLGHGAPELPRQGLVRWLLAARLALIAEETPPTRWATVDTSPKIAPFFLSQGFETASVWPHGYRAGGEMHVLRFDLATTNSEALKRRNAVAFQIAQSRCG